MALKAPLALFLILALAGLGDRGVAVAGESLAAPGASATSVTAVAARPFSESNLVALLTTTLQRDYVRDKGELELNLKQPWSAPVLPDEPLTMRILEMPGLGVTPSFIVRFSLSSAGATLGTWQTTVQARVWRDVWLAHSNLHRGEPLAGADIVHQRSDVLGVRAALAEFSNDDPGLEMAEPASAGAPLLARMVKPRAVIHRGETANALVQDGVLSISTKVEVLEDGAPGQMVRARNPISRRVLNGRVLDHQTILISL